MFTFLNRHADRRGAVTRQRRVAAPRLTLHHAQPARLEPGTFFVTTKEGRYVLYGEVLEVGEGKKWGQLYACFYGSTLPASGVETGSIKREVVSGTLTWAQWERARVLGWPSSLQGFRKVISEDEGWSGVDG